VGASIRDGDALFWIADDGAGVSEEDLPHLFDRFWQAVRADRRGAGLGLSIVKGIIDAHGGRLWAESEVGVGTTLYFTLPVAPRP
jgi:signal transduction histidine kinase